MAESTEQNTEPKASKENCLGEGTKEKNFEPSWDMVSNKLNYNFNLSYYNDIIFFFVYIILGAETSTVVSSTKYDTCSFT